MADENDAVLREMAAEVQTVRLAALHFHLLPMVAASLRSSGVPPRPIFRQLFRPAPLVDVRDLSAALTYVGEHREYFDAATARLVDGAAQHLSLRQAVNGGSAALIARCLQEDCPLLPPSDPDRVNAAKVTHPPPSSFLPPFIDIDIDGAIDVACSVRPARE